MTGPDAVAWRLVVGDGAERPGGDGVRALDGPGNMALDQALLDGVKAGGAPVLRLYRWDPATLSFGRNQPARGLYDDDAARARGIDFVRRPTGGQAVLHDDELTYAVVAPVGVVGRPREAYRRINAALVEGLRELGLGAALALGSGGGSRTGTGIGTGTGTGTGIGIGTGTGSRGGTGAGGRDWRVACFRAPAEGEVVAGGRKLVGSAQRTESRVILQHGSILVGGSQAAAESLLVDGGAGLARVGAAEAAEAGWTTLVAELGRRPEPARLVEAVVTGFERAFGITLAPGVLTPRELEWARQHREQYASRAWTWRR